ncbi:MAG: hypothetical protein NW214_16275 [Pseudanabaenaceae cyanobacterium bins.39]|nr:hypothetical protein [Pseudanabaenaceae cyanobacterium bins.39]
MKHDAIANFSLRSLGFYVGLFLSLGVSWSNGLAMANDQGTYINQRTCPPDFPSMTSALAKALPDYLNRTYQRLRIKREIMTVSFPEMEPLPIAPDQPSDRIPQQVFFSVLERQTGQIKTSQRAYWLFIVPSKYGWRLAMAFMRDGQAPPVDVSDAAIADATNRWLRDYCDSRYYHNPL